MPDGTTPPFLQAQVTKPAYRKTINIHAGQAHDDLPIQSLEIESAKTTNLKSQKMCASDSPASGEDKERGSLILPSWGRWRGSAGGGTSAGSHAKLQLCQFGVKRAFLQELGVRAPSNDAALIKHKNFIGIAHSSEAVGDH